jgi:hypothetical protein
MHFEVDPFEVLSPNSFTSRWDGRGGGGVARGVTVKVITHLPLNTKESRGQQKKKFICVTTDVDEEEKSLSTIQTKKFLFDYV